MGFQALLKFVKCWRTPDIVRETVPSSWGGKGERVCVLWLPVAWKCDHAFPMQAACRARGSF